MPTSFDPCWVQTPPLRLKTHAAPASELSVNPPTMAVLPSADSATEQPCSAAPTAPEPSGSSTLPPRVKTHAAPANELLPRPPTIAVLPSADSATDQPCSVAPTAPAPTCFAPCWVHTPPLWLKTHPAPRLPLAAGPPTMAVLPSADSATERPWSAAPTAPLPTSFGPCWVNCV